MMLFIDANRPDHTSRLLDCYMPDYESAFERLTELVGEGWSLESAIIVDDGECLDLPVEAFDGQPIQGHIQALQREWTQLMRDNPDHARNFPNPPEINTHLLRLDTYYESLLDHLEKLIIVLLIRERQARQSTHTNMNRWIQAQYALQLKNAQRLRQSTQASRQRNLKRLQQWQS